jgi:hypothetical protein
MAIPISQTLQAVAALPKLHSLDLAMPEPRTQTTYSKLPHI